MKLGRKTSEVTEDARTVARVRGALEGYLAGYGPDAAVSVRHVLDLLNPRGLWSFDPEYRKARAPEEQLPVPAGVELDPITGCRPAVPPPA